MGSTITNAGQSKWTYIDKVSYLKNQFNLPANWKELGIIVMYNSTEVVAPFFILPREVFTQDSIASYSPYTGNRFKITIAADKITRDSSSASPYSASVYYR